MTVTAVRKNKLEYHLLRADATKSFQGLYVKKINAGLTRYGLLVSEPIGVKGQCAKVAVSWLGTLKTTEETLFRLELTGPSRIRKASPGLSDGQRMFLAQVTSLDNRNDWGRMDMASDSWNRLRSRVGDSEALAEYGTAIDDESLSIGQKEHIIKLHHASNPDMSPSVIAAHWGELGAIG